MTVPETFYSVNEQLILFGISCLFGLVLGVCYDVFRTARLIFPHNSWLVVFEDILFLAGYTVFIISFASAAARGELRFYFVIGNILGFTVYLCTVGSAVIKTMRKLCSLIRCVFLFIMRPFRFIYVLLREKAAIKFVGIPENFVNSIKKTKILLLKCVHLVYNKKENKNRKNVKNVVKKSKKGTKERTV